MATHRHISRVLIALTLSLGGLGFNTAYAADEPISLTVNADRIDQAKQLLRNRGADEDNSNQFVQYQQFLNNPDVQKSGAFAGAGFHLSANTATLIASPQNGNEFNKVFSKILDNFKKATGFNGNTYNAGAGFGLLNTSTAFAVTYDHDNNTILSTRINDQVNLNPSGINNSIIVMANIGKTFRGVDLLDPGAKSFVKQPSGTALVFGGEEDQGFKLTITEGAKGVSQVDIDTWKSAAGASISAIKNEASFFDPFEQELGQFFWPNFSSDIQGESGQHEKGIPSNLEKGAPLGGQLRSSGGI